MLSEEQFHASDYSQLTPDVVIAAVEQQGFTSDLRILALNSYENRVYQIGIENGSPIIAKFYRPGRWTDAQILEEHALINLLQQYEIPVVPLINQNSTTLFNYAGYRFALFPRFGGRAPELSDPENLYQLGRYIGRIHAVSSIASFNSRPSINASTFLIEPYEFIVRQGFIPRDIEHAYRTLMDDLVKEVLDKYSEAQYQAIRLHGDCHVGNILWSDTGPTFLDFDDSRMGPAVQDIWMLLSGSDNEQRLQLSELVEGYEEFHHFNSTELTLIESLRTMRIVHYAAWIAARWSDPAFPLAFPWFGGQRFWEQHILELREQLAALHHDPLDVTRISH